MINRICTARIERARDLVFSRAVRDGRLMAVAVVDEAGGLVYADRMERAHTRILDCAIRKAYTAAVMQRDTIVLRDQDIERGKTLADWGDPRFTYLVGGVVIERDGEWFGGVAVGGHSTEGDDELARAALQTLLAP
jgi:uncharacterized protein GlcG (DUF336 family)